MPVPVPVVDDVLNVAGRGAGGAGKEAGAGGHVAGGTGKGGDDLLRAGQGAGKSGFRENAKSVAKWTAIGAAVVGGIWLIPQVMSDACNKSGEKMGMPKGSCSFISLSGCCMVCLLMVVMMFGAMSGGGGGGGGLF
jgi:hypothetical protein